MKGLGGMPTTSGLLIYLGGFYSILAGDIV
jgi:hypothetical protein